jgi:hypothetical protein
MYNIYNNIIYNYNNNYYYYIIKLLSACKEMMPIQL